MSPDAMISILKQSLVSGSLMMAPLLLTGLTIGITVGAFQAATQVNEPTLTFVPKVVGVGIVGALLLPWGLDRLVGIIQLVMSQIGHVSS